MIISTVMITNQLFIIVVETYSLIACNSMLQVSIMATIQRCQSYFTRQSGRGIGMRMQCTRSILLSGLLMYFLSLDDFEVNARGIFSQLVSSERLKRNNNKELIASSWLTLCSFSGSP